MPSPAPPAQPWSQVSVAPHTQTTLRDALPFKSGPCAPLSLGRSSPSASVQACCCINRCLYHGLGGQVQRACSCGALDRAQLQWHINCLELLAVWLALRRFKTLLHERHVLVRTDNTATVAYINHQGRLCSHYMSQLAHHLLLWTQKHLRSLRAVHVPGKLNRAADELSHQPALPKEWQLHPKVLQLIWRCFGDAQVDLFASQDTSHCQLFTPCPRGPSVQIRG